jgi:hypothetical protein
MTGVPAAFAVGCDSVAAEWRAQLCVEMLTQACAGRYYVTFATSIDSARELMRESFAATDARLPPLERARLGAGGSVFASHQVHGLYDLLFAEAWLVTVNPARFRSEEARMRVMARIAGILGGLEAPIRRELGADQIPPKTRPPGGNTG